MSSTSQEFTSAENWCGGHYGIEIDLGPPSDERVAAALKAFWSLPSVNGCYLNREQPLESQIKLDPGEHLTESRLYGTAIPTFGASVVCGTFTCRLQNENGVIERDLLSFYVPLGSLSKIYPVGAYPFSDAERASEWRQPLDDWLVEAGRFVFDRVRFQLALVGFEVDFPKVTPKAVERDGVPTNRYDGYLWQRGSALEWYPPTNFELIRISRQSEK